MRRRGNLFQPSFKLRDKRRDGARVIKRYHAPEPPVIRALAHAAVSEANKEGLRAMLAAADPVLLLAGIRASQTELGKRVDGEQRPTHRRRYVGVKPIVRTSMLDAVRDQLLTWLEAQPALTAVAALERLRRTGSPWSTCARCSDS